MPRCKKTFKKRRGYHGGKHYGKAPPNVPELSRNVESSMSEHCEPRMPPTTQTNNKDIKGEAIANLLVNAKEYVTVMENTAIELNRLRLEYAMKIDFTKHVTVYMEIHEAFIQGLDNLSSFTTLKDVANDTKTGKILAEKIGQILIKLYQCCQSNPNFKTQHTLPFLSKYDKMKGGLRILCSGGQTNNQVAAIFGYKPNQQKGDGQVKQKQQQFNQATYLGNNATNYGNSNDKSPYLTGLHGTGIAGPSGFTHVLKPVNATTTGRQKSASKSRMKQQPTSVSKSTSFTAKQQQAAVDTQTEVVKLKKKLERAIDEINVLTAKKDSLIATLDESNKQEEALRYHIQKLQHEKDNLNTEVGHLRRGLVHLKADHDTKKVNDKASLQRQVKDKEHEINRLDGLIKNQDSHIKRLEENQQKTLTKSQSRFTQNQNYIEEIQQRLFEFQKREDEFNNSSAFVEQLQQQVKQLSERLAEEMSNKMSSDERSLENVSIQNRPINVAEDYYNFCSNAWLEAKNALDDIFDGQDDEESLRFLDNILKVAEDVTKGEIQEFFTSMESFLGIPGPKGDGNQKAGRETNTGANPKSGGTKLPVEITNAVGDYMRKNNKQVDVKSLLKLITKELQSDRKWEKFHPHLRNPEIEQYIRESAEITWNMAIQRPPMTFSWDGSGQKWNEDTQEPYWKCDPYKKGSKVRYFIHPALQHGDGLMVKGKVFID